MELPKARAHLSGPPWGSSRGFQAVRPPAGSTEPCALPRKEPESSGYPILMKPPPMAVDANRLCRSGEDLGEKQSLDRQGWPWKVSKFCPRASEFACDGNRPDHSSRQHEGVTVSRLACCLRDRTVFRHHLLRAPECPPLGGFLIPPAIPVEHN